jgi:hypothetical protein
VNHGKLGADVSQTAHVIGEQDSWNNAKKTNNRKRHCGAETRPREKKQNKPKRKKQRDAMNIRSAFLPPRFLLRERRTPMRRGGRRRATQISSMLRSV